MKDENAMQLDVHVTDLLTKPGLACPLAIQRLLISNRIMRPQLTPHYGRLLRCTFPPLNPLSLPNSSIPP